VADAGLIHCNGEYLLNLLGGIGLSAFTPVLSVAVISSIHPCAPYQGIAAQPLPPVGILRLAGNPGARFHFRGLQSFTRFPAFSGRETDETFISHAFQK
jgi:hypothetical protein